MFFVVGGEGDLSGSGVGIYNCLLDFVDGFGGRWLNLGRSGSVGNCFVGRGCEYF